MVSKWRFKKKATRCSLAEKRMVSVLERKKGKPSNYQKIYNEWLKQRELALLLKQHGADKKIIDRATLLKWQTKQMLGQFDRSLERIPIAKGEIHEQRRQVERDFQEIELQKLRREVGEMFQSPLIRNAKKIIKEYQNSK